MTNMENRMAFAGHLKPLMHNRIPGQVVIQITNRCNALCPQCGMRRSAEIPRSTLSGETVRRILDACGEHRIQAVSFTGGEPFLIKEELLEWIIHAGKAGIPFIRTGTNGFFFCGSDSPGFSARIHPLAEAMARTPLRNLWISLDSSIPEVHETMRGLPGVVRGIEKALPIFHAAGIYPSANLGVNRFVGGPATSELDSHTFTHRKEYLDTFLERYIEAFDRFYRLVADLGFTMVNTCYPMSIGDNEEKSGLRPVYAASSVAEVVNFSGDEKAMLYKALLEVIPRHRKHLRIFSPLSSIHRLQGFYASDKNKTNGFECRGGRDFFFIDSKDGNTYPCGFRGNENLGKLWDLNPETLKPGKSCHGCDWECFRDPSEMFGPILQAFHEPLKLTKTLAGDPTYRNLWFKDLSYYHRCDLFNGRHP